MTLLADLHRGSDPLRVPCSRPREHGVPRLEDSLGHAHEDVSMAPKSLEYHHLRCNTCGRGGDQRGLSKIAITFGDCSKESGPFLARIKTETRESEGRSPGSARLPPDGATGLDPISEREDSRRKQRRAAATRFLRYSLG